MAHTRTDEIIASNHQIMLRAYLASHELDKTIRQGATERQRRQELVDGAFDDGVGLSQNESVGVRVAE